VSDKKINNITIITQPGPCTYAINQPVPMTCNESSLPIIKEIKMGYIRITGDPYSHYMGYSEDGELLFSINCMIPCIIEYKLEKGEGK